MLADARPHRLLQPTWSTKRNSFFKPSTGAQDLQVIRELLMKAAIYARVSTSDQNCEMQLRELREYLGRRGWEAAGEYVDTGWSGSKASRPAQDRLVKEARLRHFDAVVVWKLDR
jgi:predicted site-specific integrase-resolvase